MSMEPQESRSPKVGSRVRDAYCDDVHVLEAGGPNILTYECPVRLILNRKVFEKRHPKDEWDHRHVGALAGRLVDGLTILS